MGNSDPGAAAWSEYVAEDQDPAEVREMVWGSGYPLWLNFGQIQVGFIVYKVQFGVTFDAAEISHPGWLAPGQTDYPFWNKEWRRDALEPLATAGAAESTAWS